MKAKQPSTWSGITVPVPPEVVETFKKIAKRNDRSVAAEARRAFAAHIERES